MARIESSYKVSFDDGTVRLCYYSTNFELRRWWLSWTRLIAKRPSNTQIGPDKGAHHASITFYSSSDFKTKMQSIAGRKICFRQFNDYFFGISHKVTSSEGEIAIENFEFSMNSFHDLYLQNLKYNRSLYSILNVFCYEVW